MAANNVKTAFRLPSGVNEDFIRNLIWQHQQQQQHQKNIKQQQQNIKRFMTGVYSYEKGGLKNFDIFSKVLISIQCW